MENIKFICPYCNKEYESKNAFWSHKGKCKSNPNYVVKPKSEKWIETMKNLKPWTYGLTKESSEKLKAAAEKCSSTLKGRPGHKVSEETKKKISETCKKNKLSGGYRKGSGRGKKGIYKGYYCDSSWELAYVIYNLDHNIKFERNEELFPYEFNGEQHKYKPDFIEGDTYVEIKGYFTEQVKAKERAFPFKLKYIDGEAILPYLKYVEQKYGKDFIKLYE